MIDRLAWILAVTLGFAAGGFAFHFPGSYGSPVVNVPAGIFGLILGAINGLLVGAFVWAALRLSRRTGLRILATMVLLVGATHGLNDGAPFKVPFVVVEAIAGLLAAGIVAWILGERRAAALAVVAVAWTVGLVLGGWSGNVIGLPFTETGIGWAQDHAWDGLIAGLVWGGATAAIGIPNALRGRSMPGQQRNEPLVAG